MASEIRIQAGLQVSKGNCQFRSQLPASGYVDDLLVARGPTPGTILVDTLGVDVDFSNLGRPGWCWLQNQDASNYVEVGVYDPETDVFTPFAELRAGKGFPLPMSRNFGSEYDGTGTGTTAKTNRLRLKANRATCSVFVGAFEGGDS